MIEMVLPWPPTVNHYWEGSGRSTRVGPKGLAFRQEVWLEAKQRRIKLISTPVAVIINAFPPDKRKRDLDNLLKATLDGLQHAGILSDDNQVQCITIRRESQIIGCLKLQIVSA